MTILRLLIVGVIFHTIQSVATAATAAPQKIVIAPANDLTETLRQLNRIELNEHYPEAAAKTKSLRAN
jgi:hypothetical protein